MRYYALRRWARSLPFQAAAPLRWLRKRRTVPEQVNRVALLSMMGIGDTVVTTPVFRALKARFPEAEIHLWCQPHVKCLMDLVPELDQVHPLAFDGSRRSARELAEQMRPLDFDVGIHFGYGFRETAVMRRAGVRYAIGYASYHRGLALDHALPMPVYAHRPAPAVQDDSLVMQEVDLKLAALESLGVQNADRTPRLALTPELEAFGKEFFDKAGFPPDSRIIGLQPGAKHPSYEWPVGRFAEVIERLSADASAHFCVFGGPDNRDTDTALQAEIVPELHERVVSVVGKTTLDQTAALLSRCKPLISTDTGTGHLAAALGRPVVSLFGPGDARIWRPFGDAHTVLVHKEHCYGCKKPRCLLGTHSCMAAISTDEVVQAAQRYLTPGN